MHYQISPNKIRQVLFIILIIVLGILVLKELYFMITAFLGSVTLYMVLQKWMIKLSTSCKMKKWISAILLILFSLLFVVLPLIWIGVMVYERVTFLIKNFVVVKGAFIQINEYLILNWDIDILNHTYLDKVINLSASFAQDAIGSTLNIALNLVVMFLILYFLLVNHFQVEIWVHKHLPLKKVNSNLAIDEFKRLVLSNAIGIPLVAIVQGIAAFVGYLIFGVDDALLLGVITAIFSVIPMVGSSLVWIPLSIYLLSQGQNGAALGIALWGFLLIGSIDNVARFLLQRKIGNVHPLITIFGVIVGINLFGFIGLIFGPLFVSMFFLMVKIYNDEFGKSIKYLEAPGIPKVGKERI